MSAIVIREYAAEYKEELITMILAIQQQEFEIAVSRKDQPDLDDIPQFYQQANGGFWIALNDDEVVGTIGLIDIGNQQAALRKMFVKAAFRGAQHGVAQALLQTVTGWTAEHCVKTIYLGTTDKFRAAHRFYEKNEFVKIDKGELPASFPVMKVDTVFYRAIV